MRAVRWHGRRDVRLDDLPAPPSPRAHEVLVQVEWCGICGTDLEEYLHGPLLVPTTPHPLTGFHAPLVLGHEVSARVVEAGSTAALQPGRLVALDGYYFCGTCPGCLRHQVQLCERWGHIGLSAPGGLAELMTVPARMALPATAEVASDALALAEPFSVAVRALRRGCVQGGERVGVVGGGTIGLAVSQVAGALGAEVTLAEPEPARRALAGQLGAEAVADVELLGSGYDAVFDCSGVAAAAAAALLALRQGGRLVAVGIPLGTAELDLRRIVLDELSVLGSIGHVWDEDFADAVRLICEGVVDPAPLISHRISLGEAVSTGFDLLAGRAGSDVRKILVSPHLPD